MVLFWFQLYNGFSGSNAINALNLIFFNLIFTALPPIVIGIWEQDVSCDTLIKKPYLYKLGQENEVCSNRRLFYNVIFNHCSFTNQDFLTEIILYLFIALFQKIVLDNYG